MKGHPILSIDPGTAFGTGSHETTRLVIRQLQKYVKPGDEVLDVGCGSGILSVVALKYGAAHAFGTDLDPNAIIASHENAEQNDITPSQLEVIEGNIIDDKAIKDACGYEKYDIVCANILADVLEPLSTCIHEHMKVGAYFITSGIIDMKEEEVVTAFKANPHLEIVEVNHDGEWVNVTARRAN
jgi:ribosomal protein L11 methyltransferase